MPSYRTGTVTSVSSERPGLQKVEVDGEPAYVLTELIGPVAQGDEVVINTTAVDLGLGTGGWHFVHWNLSRREWSHPGPGHIMKLRYTSLQADVGAAEEGSDPGDRLPGTVVVACALHSQLPVVAAAVHAVRPGTRVGYVMTDGGALPLALSDTVATLRDRGLLATTVTAGQAFGGDHEAVNVLSGLAVAARSGCEVVVAGTGPGVVGTGTALGHTGVEVAAIVDGAAALGGRPVVAVRWSDGDARARHQGLSHHSATALNLASRPHFVAVPSGAGISGGEASEVVETEQLALDSTLDGLAVTTMGRGPGDDPGFFAFAAAAGRLAADLVGAPDRYPRPA